MQMILSHLNAISEVKIAVAVIGAPPTAERPERMHARHSSPATGNTARRPDRWYYAAANRPG